MAQVPAELLRIYVPGDTSAEALPHLQETYADDRLRGRAHLLAHRARLAPSRDRVRRAPWTDGIWRPHRLLERLVGVEALERFLHKAYLGQKRFSIEGLDSLVPMLDVIIGDAADQGARKVMIGMAHRGRLNVLAHIVGVSYETILAEFEAGRAGVDTATAPKGESDDVKYHLGAEGAYLASDDSEVRVVLSPNPSHLEAVDPVITGRASGADRPVRPDRTHRQLHDAPGPDPRRRRLRRPGRGGRDPEPGPPGRLCHRAGPCTSSRTTRSVSRPAPREGRSTDYSSDLAKGFDVPIIHVNADDPEACPPPPAWR